MFGVTERIEILEDGRFVQSLEMPNGRTLRNTNAWSLDHRAITLNRYLHFYGFFEKHLVDPPQEAVATYAWYEDGLVNTWDTGSYILKKID